MLFALLLVYNHAVIIYFRIGAEAVNQPRQNWTPLNIHQTHNLNEKMRIAKAAAELCQPGESVVINCGSTAFLIPLPPAQTIVL
jgi:DeoR/GlpR family transcriptional regulator of sugar metabolism